MNEDFISILKDIQEKVGKVEKRLESIEEHLGIVKEDCSKMGNHIDFIEKTYSVLRTPLNYLTRMVCKRSNDLPTINQNQIE